MQAELSSEQVTAMKFLVKQSPVCEVDDIVDFLSTLIGSRDLLLQSENVMKAFKKWYETHRFHIVLPDGRKAMVTAQGNCAEESDDPKDMFQYYDSTLQLVFKFDPLQPSNSEIVSNDPMAVSSNELREALVPAVGKYLEKAYADN